MKALAPRNLRSGLAALVITGSLLTSLQASAQTEDFNDEATAEEPTEEAPLVDSGVEAPPVDSSEGEEAPPVDSSVEATETPEPPVQTEPERSTEPAARKPFIGFAPPLNPARIENDTISLRLGLFAQPQFEAVGAPDATKSTKNIYLRNVGVILSGTLLDYFEFFFDVNYPNLFKVDPTNQTGGTSKNAPGLNVQDAIFTFKPFGKKPYGNALKFDAGFMLPPSSHNGDQGAFTLYSLDYFVNTFRRNVLTTADPFKSNGQSPQGRDTGVEVRGLLFGDHLEYRAGLFQGLRVGPVPASQGTEAEVGSVNFFRFAGRVQVNILDAEKDFFYEGSYLGEKKVLSIGGFYDFQDNYVSAGGDLFVDLPLGPGVLTGQVDVMYWDGGNFIQTLPKHTAYMGEVGYTFQKLMLSPILRMEYLNPAERTASTPSEARYGGGLSFWPWGHTSNLKAFYTYVKRDPAPQPYNQVNVQWQLYF